VERKEKQGRDRKEIESREEKKVIRSGKKKLSEQEEMKCQHTRRESVGRWEDLFFGW